MLPVASGTPLASCPVIDRVDEGAEHAAFSVCRSGVSGGYGRPCHRAELADEARSARSSRSGPAAPPTSFRGSCWSSFQAQLGQPIVVENRGGAGGTVGSAAVAKAEPDGYTILVNSSAHTITPSIYPSLSYDTGRDFVAVAAIGNVPNVLIIAPSKGLKTVQEFVAGAKAKPGSFNFASVGVGSAVHLSAERFRLSAGYEAVHIPFKGGAEALTEVIAGRVDYYFCPIATALPHVREGRLLGLAVSSPDARFRHAGRDDHSRSRLSEFGLHVLDRRLRPRPARPLSIVAKLHQRTDEGSAGAGGREKLATLGVEPMPLTSTEFEAQVKKEIVLYGTFAKAAGLKPN